MVEVTDYTESYNLDKQSPSVFQFFTLPTVQSQFNILERKTKPSKVYGKRHDGCLDATAKRSGSKKW